MPVGTLTNHEPLLERVAPASRALEAAGLREATAGRAGSWTALVAATTLGVRASDTVFAEVRGDVVEASGEDVREYRLVVQSYRASTKSGRPSRRSRPVASMQRAVTADELREGVSVRLVELGDVGGAFDAPAANITGDRRTTPRSTGRPMVVAWVEAGKPDLEYDGRMARPRRGSVYGAVKKSATGAQLRIRLGRGLAA